MAGYLNVVKVKGVEDDADVTTVVARGDDDVLGKHTVLNDESLRTLDVKASTDHETNLVEDGVGDYLIVAGGGSGVHDVPSVKPGCSGCFPYVSSLGHVGSESKS